MDSSKPPAPSLQGRHQLATPPPVAEHAGGEGLGAYFANLTGNPFFTAGFSLAALATAARLGQQGLRHGAHLLRRRMLVDLEITRFDVSYPWVLHWMTTFHRAQAAGTPRSAGMGWSSKPGIIMSMVKRFNPRLHHLQVETSTPESGPMNAAHFSFVPGPGKHLLRYGSSFIMVDRQREKSINVGTGLPFETVTLTTLYSQRHVFESIFAEAHRLYQQMQEGKTVIYNSRGVDWEPFGDPKRKRPLESVVLELGVKERIVEDVQAFIKARNWYHDRGIPYRRGYLLYGPPGTGKSSFIQALAGHLDFNIAILNVSERGLTDDRLNHLLTKVPRRTIVLLEDVDVAFANRQMPGADGYSGATVTFSGLLNALDGVASAEERIIFLTTNHVDRLDEALIRPGRVDMTVRLGHATAYQMEGIWDRFYGDMDPTGEAKQRFMARAKELGLIDHVSTAALQGLFLYNKDSADGAIAMMEGLSSARDSRQPHVDMGGHVDVG